MLPTHCTTQAGLPRRRMLPVFGLSIAIHESEGQGGPAVFCLHGNSHEASDFMQLLTGDLGRQVRVVAMDLPGHGSSSRARNPDQACSMAGLIRVVCEVVKMLDLGPTVFVGHSLGGHILTRCAPELVGMVGLLLIGTPPLGSPPRFDLAFLPHASSGYLFQAHLSAAEIHQWAAAQERQCDSERLQHYEDAIQHTDGRCRESLGRSVGLHESMQDECEILRQLKVPVGLVLGEEDLFVNREYCESVPLPNLWRGGVQLMAGSGHAPQMEVPEAFDAVLKVFMATCMLERGVSIWNV
ncbi:MAG: alpha/beta hydrolase [Magnetococcales bacterium]|nr:alpha/beta hydrolase [Magnetococcales bacterium]MBF0438945.1 alpha/beta hydrolase [Magnetococcales bacterium]